MNIGDVKIKNWWLYVLELEEGRFYVGVSTQPEKRFQQHKSGYGGAAWTKKYKPIGMIDKKDLGKITFEEAELYENKVVRAYIKKYGIENVRGGDFRITERYRKLFGNYYEERDYEALKVISVLSIIMLFMTTLIILSSK